MYLFPLFQLQCPFPSWQRILWQWYFVPLHLKNDISTVSTEDSDLEHFTCYIAIQIILFLILGHKMRLRFCEYLCHIYCHTQTDIQICRVARGMWDHRTTVYAMQMQCITSYNGSRGNFCQSVSLLILLNLLYKYLIIFY